MAPTRADVNREVARLQSQGGEENMKRAAEVEREGEKARLAELRAEKADTPEREALEAAYGKQGGGTRSTPKPKGK